MSQNWGLCVAHLTLDRDLRLHVHLTEPCPEDRDDRAWDDKYGSEVHHSDKLDQHGHADLDEPRKVIGYGAVHWKTGVISSRHQTPKNLQARMSWVTRVITRDVGVVSSHLKGRRNDR